MDFRPKQLWCHYLFFLWILPSAFRGCAGGTLRASCFCCCSFHLQRSFSLDLYQAFICVSYYETVYLCSKILNQWNSLPIYQLIFLTSPNFGILPHFIDPTSSEATFLLVVQAKEFPPGSFDYPSVKYHSIRFQNYKWLITVLFWSGLRVLGPSLLTPREYLELL